MNLHKLWIHGSAVKRNRREIGLIKKWPLTECRYCMTCPNIWSRLGENTYSGLIGSWQIFRCECTVVYWVCMLHRD